FRAFLAGDALGNLTPLGMAASEPAKAFLIRHHLATREAVASLALDNLVYGATIVAVVGAGLVVLLLTASLPFGWQEGALGLLAALALGSLLAVRRLRRGAWRESRGARPAWREPLTALRQSVVRFSEGHPTRLWRIFALGLLFHALAVLEVF